MDPQGFRLVHRYIAASRCMKVPTGTIEDFFGPIHDAGQDILGRLANVISSGGLSYRRASRRDYLTINGCSAPPGMFERF